MASPAKSKAKDKAPPPATLSTEERRARVERVRGVADTELAQLESALLDAQARIPALVGLVQGARGVLKKNTEPIKEESG